MGTLQLIIKMKIDKGLLLDRPGQLTKCRTARHKEQASDSGFSYPTVNTEERAPAFCQFMPGGFTKFKTEKSSRMVGDSGGEERTCRDFRQL